MDQQKKAVETLLRSNGLNEEEVMIGLKLFYEFNGNFKDLVELTKNISRK